MIRWLVQSGNDHPVLLQGSAPSALLNERERARLAQLSVEKRRRDWLLGRWTAKQLLKTVLQQDMNIDLPLTSIGIENEPGGAPYALLEGGRLPGIEVGNRLPYQLSISHSNGYAFCAVQPGNDDRFSLGADMEQIEVREQSFVETFFSEVELETVRSAPALQRDLLVTAIWSAKEAALKALREGLRVDTRKVCCRIEPGEGSPSEWRPLTVDICAGVVGPANESWPGWWRIQNHSTRFVLSMVARQAAGRP